MKKLKTGHAFISMDEDPPSVERKLNFIFPTSGEFHVIKTETMDGSRSAILEFPRQMSREKIVSCHPLTKFRTKILSRFRR